jgi:hypothetical protein
LDRIFWSAMRLFRNARCVGMSLAGLLLGGVCLRGYAQASALPSAQTGGVVQSTNGVVDDPVGKGNKLVEEMIAALGGDAWLNRQDWIFEGRAATFYKGAPHEGAPQFQEYFRASPFGERVIIISHYGVIIATNHSDVAEVWTDENGYEITYKGTHPLPEKDVDDYVRRHKHSLDVVVRDWLKQPGVLVTYEGEGMVERHLAQQVSIVTTNNDAVTLQLDEGTHLPLSISFQWRDPIYRDLNTDVQEFTDYHAVQGIQTAYAITMLHNGDMTGERFLTKVVYNAKLPADLFDPNRKLEKKAK